jgi:hypothetical protein
LSPVLMMVPEKIFVFSLGACCGVVAGIVVEEIVWTVVKVKSAQATESMIIFIGHLRCEFRLDENERASRMPGSGEG